jgi:hypothetical protein
MGASQSTTTTAAPEISNERSLEKALDDFFANIGKNENIPKAVEHSLGLEYLNSGSYRNVFEFPDGVPLPIDNPDDFVLKVDKDSGFSNANKWEVDAMYMLPDKIYNAFCVPIAAYSNSFKWIIMPKVEMSCINYSREQQFQHRLEALGWEYNDCKSSNMGWFNGELKLVDYGLDWINPDGKYVVETS